MKNVDELYKKFYNTYKNDYDADELNQGKKKKFDYRQSELFDKTDKELKLGGETKVLLKRLKIKKKALIKRYLRNILATNLLHQ